MTIFSQGDIVACVDNHRGSVLLEGSHYVVEQGNLSERGLLVLRGFPDKGFDASRFRLYRSADQRKQDQKTYQKLNQGGYAALPVDPSGLDNPSGYGSDIAQKDYREFGSRKGEALKDKDNVNLPEHYARFKHEPVRFSMENRLDAFQFNILKYTCRHDSKNGIEDIDKVIRYATMYKRFLLGDPDWWKAPK